MIFCIRTSFPCQAEQVLIKLSIKTFAKFQPVGSYMQVFSEIWTHNNCDVKGMGVFLILRHKLLCIPVFKEILHCQGGSDVKSRID